MQKDLPIFGIRNIVFLPQIEDEIELVGVVRHNEAKSPFVPAARENDRFLHYRNVYEMAAMSDAVPIFLDANVGEEIRKSEILLINLIVFLYFKSVVILFS